LFNREGKIAKALEVPVKIAKALVVKNKYQNGCVLTINAQLLTHHECIDITELIAP
jgi:hypothetical protein